MLKNKLFFFGSTEWTRVRSGATLTAAVPTPQFLALTPANVQDFFNTYGGGKTFNFNQIYASGPAGIGSISGNPGWHAGLWAGGIHCSCKCRRRCSAEHL